METRIRNQIKKHTQKITTILVGIGGVLGTTFASYLRQYSIPHITELLTVFLIASTAYYITFRVTASGLTKLQ